MDMKSRSVSKVRRGEKMSLRKSLLCRRTAYRWRSRRSDVHRSCPKVIDRISLLIDHSLFRHRYFERRNNDLYANLTITLQDALNGFDLSIPHLDGRKVNIQRQQITWPGLRIKQQGKGLPHHDRNTIMGDLYITVDVDFPQGQLNNEQREGKRVLGQRRSLIAFVQVIVTLFHQQSQHQLYNGF
jgi:DnaJ-class molecular chaperone